MAFRLSNKRCEEIKEIVVNTLEELNMRAVPINAFEMATKLGAEVVHYAAKPEETRRLMMERARTDFPSKRTACGTFFITIQKVIEGSITRSLTNVNTLC